VFSTITKNIMNSKQKKHQILKLFVSHFNFYLFFLSIVLVAGCNKEEIGNDKMLIKLTPDYNSDLANFTKTVAKGLSDVDFRLFIKNEAIKQFDGDYDILLASNYENKILTKSANSAKTLYSFLSSINNNTLKSASSTNNAFLDSLIIKYPLLQISIPETFNSSAENWDAASEEILVTFLPSDYDEKTTSFLTAYDSNGNTTQISAKEEPIKPVIVISLNERLQYHDINLKSTQNSIYFKNNHYAYYFPSSQEFNDLNDESVQLKSLAISYDRDLKSGSDILWQGRFVSKDAFRQVEGWPAGKPEFTVIIAYIDKGTGAPVASSLTKILSSDGWISRYVFYSDLRTKNLNIPILRWYKDRYGLDMKYHWMEKDSGGDTPTEITTTITTKYDDNTTSTLSVKHTFDNNDEDAGESIVQYEDNTDGDGTEYNTGIMRFWIKQ